jgi:hypothetical protein
VYSDARPCRSRVPSESRVLDQTESSMRVPKHRICSPGCFWL